MDTPTNPPHSGPVPDSQAPEPLYTFVIHIRPDCAVLTLEEVHSGAILDERRFPLTSALFPVRVAAAEMWADFCAHETEIPTLPGIRGEFHPNS